MNQHRELFKKLAAAWEGQRFPHARPATDAEVGEFEGRYGVRLPADLRAYSSILNGGDLGHDGSMDHELICFWRLDQVRTQEELNEGQGGRQDLFGFADWSVDCQTYVIQLQSDPEAPTPVFIDYGPKLQKVAATFSDFIAGYLRADEAVLYGITRPSTSERQGPSA